MFDYCCPEVAIILMLKQCCNSPVGTVGNSWVYGVLYEVLALEQVMIILKSDAPLRGRNGSTCYGLMNSAGSSVLMVFKFCMDLFGNSDIMLLLINFCASLGLLAHQIKGENVDKSDLMLICGQHRN